VVDRAARGEQITITRSGRTVAELRAVSHPPLSAGALLSRWRRLPPVYTCNPADFSGIDGLEVVPVPVPETAQQ
jgi:antitoxin (DNA-binding transcriptional repressor) of toxin-antitoxin stability system